MSKMDKQIVVVPTKILFEKKYFEGFCSSKEYDYQDVMLRHYIYMRRGDAEENVDFKQPIGYCLIVNSERKTFFVYQRAKKDSQYTETRLQGKWSCGVGGHIDEEDDVDNPIHMSTLRELHEEVHVTVLNEPKVLGYINNDANEVGKVHFGVLYLVETNEAVLPKASEIANGHMVTLAEFDSLCEENDAEGWTKIAASALRDLWN